MIYTIYGRPKVGKTTLSLKGCPSRKTAIINSDNGLIGQSTKGITVIDDVSLRNLNETIRSPEFLHQHSYVVIDTATKLYEDLLFDIAGGKSPSLQNRMQANNEFATLLRNLQSPSRRIIVLCQEKLFFPEEEWVSDDDDEVASASVSIDMPPGPSKILLTMSDMIARLYIAKTQKGYTRRLWMTPTDSIVAGARSSRYTGKPPYLVNPTIPRVDQLLGWNK